MRTREGISRDMSLITNTKQYALLLEVLLDIRDLLSDKREPDLYKSAWGTVRTIL